MRGEKPNVQQTSSVCGVVASIRWRSQRHHGFVCGGWSRRGSNYDSNSHAKLDAWHRGKRYQLDCTVSCGAGRECLSAIQSG
jgi:hypothetical protein